jgi:alkanesulfonate monooxygenase SsuD/methylene tetrahydromethanopterin reductase-like flavin-dependent oxidoreductase (luciferase family)
MATTVDQISGGRVDVGIGAGWYEFEHRAFGFPFVDLSTRLELFAEHLEIVYRQFTEEVFDFNGKHFTLEGCRANPKPVQKPHPPLIVGGSGGEGTIAPAIRFATEYNTGLVSAAVCGVRRQRLDEACERAGRDPATLHFSLMTRAIIAENESTLNRRVARVQQRLSKARSAEKIERRITEASIIGTAEQAVERLKELEAVGVERVMLQHILHEDLEMIALVGREVIPRLT